MRLIDADELKDWSEIVPLTGDGGIDINDFDEKLKSMPTVDAVPVIRCKDCKHYADDQCDRYADETLGYEHSTQAYGYCWLAERKE